MKLVSPFVATIILVIITISIGIAVYMYLSSVTKTSTSTEEVINCLGGDFKIINFNYPKYEFKYSREIIIDNTQNSNNLNDYQILVTIDTSYLISNNYLKNDCSDIRFLDSDKSTLLNYWIEGPCNSQNTKIWVKVPNIPANSKKIIHFVSGNPNANSLSNASNVFIRIIDGVIVSWHFDEGSGNIAYDSSGNNNHATIYGATWVDGKFGKALSFDGVDDYVKVVNFGGSTEMTIEMWVYDRTPLGQNCGNPLSWGYPWTSWGKGIVFYSGYGGNTYGVMTSYNNYYEYAIPGSPNSWIQVVLRVSKSGKFWESFKNSQKTYHKDITDFDPTLADLYISLYFNGIIDEVMIFNKVLTEDEIKDLYNYYGYTTPNYPGRVLIKNYTSPEPTISLGNELGSIVIKLNDYSFNLYFIGNPQSSLGSKYIAYITLINDTIIKKDIDISPCNLGSECISSPTIKIETDSEIRKIEICSKTCSFVCSKYIVLY